MISRTEIKSRIVRKSDSNLAEAISLALKTKSKTWHSLAAVLSSSTRKFSSVNLDKIEKATKVGDTVIILGKVLSQGDVTKKIKIVALKISEKALEKLKKTKSEFVSLKQEIQQNKTGAGLKVLR